MSWSSMVVAVVMVSVATTVVSAQSPPQIDVSGWKTYRNDSMGFEAKHPSDWHVSVPTGSGPENVLMRAPRQGEQSPLTIQFWVQRQMNPQGVAIEQWYGDQMKRMPAESTKGITTTNTVIGGRPAVHRTRVGTLGRSADFFVALNRTDLFQISILRPAAETQLDPTLEKLLSTVKFLQ
jgi:hypothetical protein